MRPLETLQDPHPDLSDPNKEAIALAVGIQVCFEELGA